jgi:hypothetical protein
MTRSLASYREAAFDAFTDGTPVNVEIVVERRIKGETGGLGELAARDFLTKINREKKAKIAAGRRELHILEAQNARAAMILSGQIKPKTALEASITEGLE